MMQNPVVETLLKRKSIRKYTSRKPTDEEVETLARAAQQAPFSGQMCSLLLKQGPDRVPYGAPLLFTICFDMHKLEKIMEKRGWSVRSCDLSLLLFGMQDAVLMSENLVIAAESLGMGSCFIGNTAYIAKTIAEQYGLPRRVYPFVQLVAGFPAEDPPVRPRYPLEYFLFQDRYPDMTDEMIERAMTTMDQGYLAQDYYRSDNFMIPLEVDREETYTFDDYSWTEHMCRKWGQWAPSPETLVEGLRACGFDLNSSTEKK
jgi:nitroreductase